MRLQTGPSHCCITQKYAVKSAAVFAISAADRVFACSKPASGRGALTHEYCLWCDGPGTFTIASSFTVLHVKLFFWGWENCKYKYLSTKYVPPPALQYQECEGVTLTESWRVWLLVCGGATPDINTIEIILWSRLGFYTNTVTLLLPLLSLGSLATKNWTQRSELRGKNQNMILGSTKPLIPAPASSGLREKQRNIPYVTAVPVQKSLAGSRKTLSNRCLFRSCSTFDSDNTGPHIESDTNHYLHWTAFAARRTPAAVCCLSRSKETCNAEQLGEYYKNTFQSIIDQVILEIYSVLGLYHWLWRQ